MVSSCALLSESKPKVQTLQLAILFWALREEIHMAPVLCLNMLDDTKHLSQMNRDQSGWGTRPSVQCHAIARP